MRARILARDGGRCQLGYPGTYIATEIDDIIPVSLLGGVPREELTDDKRQSVCSSCPSRQDRSPPAGRDEGSGATPDMSAGTLPLPKKHPGEM